MKQWKFLGEDLITNINTVKVSLDFDYVWGKIPHQETAKNGISERLDFEIFWGAHPQTPLKLAPSTLSQLPRLSEKSG